MPKNKNAYIRYRIIDSCLRERKKPFPGKQELIEACMGIGTVSLRTIEKDLYDMQYDEELGYFAPIKYNASRKGYYYEDPEYSINKLPLKREDLTALAFACSLLKQFEGVGPVKQFMESVTKIEDYVNMHHIFGNDDFLNLIQVEHGLTSAGNEHLSALLTAIKDQTVLCLQYKRFGDSPAKTYTFHPYVLKEYRNRWYVTGKTPQSHRISTFALERINSLEPTHEKFLHDKDFNAKDYFKYSFGISVFNHYTPEKVELSFTPQQAPFIKSQPWHATQQILRDDKKEFRIRIEVIPSYELKSQILSYGDQVKVIRPEKLATEVKETLSKAASRY
jgi:predicted DNA-binding transcriptional regulator YafY